MNSYKILKYIKKYSYLLLGLFIYSVAFNMFMLPNNFVVGGVSGISIILNKYFGFDASLTVSILSTLLLILGFIFCNKDRVFSSVASTFILPVFIKLTSGLPELINLDISLLLASIYCSLMVGFALGLVYKVGFSTGGTDILYWIVEKYIKKSTGQIMMIVEGIIVLTGAFVFGFERLMYSLIILFLMSKLSDRIVIGISDSKMIYILPDKLDDICSYLNSVSYIKSFNLKTIDDKNVLFCVVASKDYRIVYEHIKDIDKKAFISSYNTYEVIGG